MTTSGQFPGDRIRQDDAATWGFVRWWQIIPIFIIITLGIVWMGWGYWGWRWSQPPVPHARTAPAAPNGEAGYGAPAPYAGGHRGAKPFRSR